MKNVDFWKILHNAVYSKCQNMLMTSKQIFQNVAIAMGIANQHTDNFEISVWWRKKRQQEDNEDNAEWFSKCNRRTISQCPKDNTEDSIR